MAILGSKGEDIQKEKDYTVFCIYLDRENYIQYLYLLGCTVCGLCIVIIFNIRNYMQLFGLLKYKLVCIKEL